MKIIDSHIHTNFDHIENSVRCITNRQNSLMDNSVREGHISNRIIHKTAKEFANSHEIDFSWKAMQRAMKDEKIEAIIAITTATNSETPGESDLLLEQAVPKKYHELVFYRNAKRVFGI